MDCTTNKRVFDVYELDLDNPIVPITKRLLSGCQCEYFKAVSDRIDESPVAWTSLCVETTCKNSTFMAGSYCAEHARNCASCSCLMVQPSQMHYMVRNQAWIRDEFFKYMFRSVEIALRVDEHTVVVCEVCSKKEYSDSNPMTTIPSDAGNMCKFPMAVIRCDVGASGNDCVCSVEAVCESVQCAHCRIKLVDYARRQRGDVAIVDGEHFCGSCAGVNSVAHCNVAKCDWTRAGRKYVSVFGMLMCTEHVCSWSLEEKDRVWRNACKRCKRWICLGTTSVNTGIIDSDGQYVHSDCSSK